MKSGRYAGGMTERADVNGDGSADVSVWSGGRERKRRFLAQDVQKKPKWLRIMRKFDYICTPEK